MSLHLLLAWIDLALAVDAAVSTAPEWGPPAAACAVLLALAWLALSDSARTRVRTLSAPLLHLPHFKPLTCKDTCPDTSADTSPDTSGHDPRGGR
ncbi:hypothetical protein AB0N14_17470 [Streptomyces sp. NPDC051104]|uniref:hypothetical protein n=1 Tax=Streptomyces sp. NPDC051104 TaxID=3155044 RepID=UPI003445B705